MKIQLVIDFSKTSYIFCKHYKHLFNKILWFFISYYNEVYFDVDVVSVRPTFCFSGVRGQIKTLNST